MRTRFHRLLLVVMMLALPLQAFASASMIGCALSEHPAAPVAAADAGMSGCHESAPQSDSAPAQHSCAHCAACSLTSIPLLPAMVALSPLPATGALIPDAADRFSGFIPEGPERPPRSRIA